MFYHTVYEFFRVFFVVFVWKIIHVGSCEPAYVACLGDQIDIDFYL